MNRITNSKAKETRLFTLAEAAEHVQVSKRFLYVLFHTGQLVPTHKTDGGTILYSRAQLDKFVRKREKIGRRGRPYNEDSVATIDWKTVKIRKVC